MYDSCIGHLCPAISKAVKTMRRGEKAELAVKFSCKSVLLVPYKAVRIFTRKLTFHCFYQFNVC